MCPLYAEYTDVVGIGILYSVYRGLFLFIIMLDGDYSLFLFYRVRFHNHL